MGFLSITSFSIFLKMKRFLTFLMLILSLVHYVDGAVALKYVSCSPEEGSSIDSFDIDLTFDISETIAEYGESDDYGIFVSGNSIDVVNRSIKLYHGNVETGSLISTIYNYSMGGTHDDFKTGNVLHLSFPGIIPVEGELYTVCVRTPISVGKLGETKKYSGDIFYHQTPLVLTFIGKENGETELFGLKSWSVSGESPIEDLNFAEIEFSKPISVDSSVSASLMRQNNSGSSYLEITKGSISVSDSNPCVAVINFGEQPAFNGVNYKIVLPEGVVSDVNNPSSTIPESSVVFSGSKKLTFSFVDFEPVLDNYGALSSLKLKFDIDQSIASSITSDGVVLYVLNENGERVCTLRALASELPYRNFSFTMPLSASTKYKVVVDENTLFGFDDQFWKQSYYICEPFEFSFTTPLMMM